MPFVFGDVHVTNAAPTDPTLYFTKTVNRTTNAAIELIEAPGSGKFLVIEAVWWTNADLDTDTKVEFYKTTTDADASTNVLLRGAGLALGGASVSGRIILPENTALVVKCTAATSIDVDINATGYIATVGA
jgi:hypothetical protein